MKTDIKEMKDGYELEIDLPGFKKDEVTAENAFNQIRNYMQDIPPLFYYNAICVISDFIDRIKRYNYIRNGSFHGMEN